MTSPSNESESAGQENPFLTQEEAAETIPNPFLTQDEQQDAELDAEVARIMADAPRRAEETARLLASSSDVLARARAEVERRQDEVELDAQWQPPPPTYEAALRDPIYQPGPEGPAARLQPGRRPDEAERSDIQSVAARREQRELERRQSRENLGQDRDPDLDLGR